VNHLPITFGTPAFLAALAILIPVLITFLVKKQRRVMKVPSTMLWRLGAKSISKSKRIRNIHRLIALLACLAGVALLAVAAARPGGKRATTTVYVVDVSASMAGAPMDDVRHFLIREVAALGPNGRVSIITAGDTPIVALPPSGPGPVVDRAISSLSAQSESSSLEDAVSLAEGLNAHVIVLSDHAYEKDASRGGWTEQKVFARSGPKKGMPDNLGITSLYTRTAPDAHDDEEREATIIVASSSTVARRARVKVVFANSVLSDRTIDVPAQGEATENVTVRGAGKLVAHVSSDDGRSDALAIDDEATLQESARRPPKVALIRRKGTEAPTYFFVSRALEAAGVTELEDVDIADKPPTKSEVAVVLDDGPARPKDIPAFYILTAPNELALDAKHAVGKNQAHLRSVANEDLLMRGVALDELTSNRATVAKAPHGARSLVDLDGGSALIAGGTGKNAWVWMGLDPEQSDLVLKVAFPVLIGNLMSQLGGQSTVITAKTAPRDEVMLAQNDVAAALPDAAEPRWRMPAGPPAFLALIGAAFLAFEAWWSFRRRNGETKKEAAKV
jgi:hypothetical protein